MACPWAAAPSRSAKRDWIWPLYNASTPSKQAERPDYLVGFATPARAPYLGGRSGGWDLMSAVERLDEQNGDAARGAATLEAIAGEVAGKKSRARLSPL